MAMIKELTDTTGAAISWAFGALTTSASEVVNISQHNEQGILVVAVTHDMAGTPAIKVNAGVDYDNMAPLLDSSNNEISLTLTSKKKVFHLANVHASFIQVYGSANGSSGSITGIKIIAK